MVLFAMAVTTYPSKGTLYSTCERLLHYTEQNIRSIPLIIETMKEEGEDEEIVATTELLNKKPTVTTLAEVQRLCRIVADYIKWQRIIKVKDSFIHCLDIIEEGDEEENIHETVEALYKMSNEIVSAYNSATFTTATSQFDTSNPEQMKAVIAETQDSRSSNKTIVTGIRMLNNMLSPGYLAGCVYIYTALPGCYKSGILLQSHIDTCKYNEHIKQTTGGKRPVSIYISMENTMTQTVRRLWSLLFPTADLSMYSAEEASSMIKNELEKNGFRSVLLYYGYREKSTADLYEIIRGFNDDNNVVVALYLDYIKRIRSARTDAAVMSSEKSELHAIMNELKSVAAQFDIPIVSGHQLNRAAAAAVDAVVQNGGYGKTIDAMGRSNVGTAWEVMEVADWLVVQNIENDGETKRLVIKAVKQRDLDSSNSDIRVTAFKHPFLSPESFALRQDINENCSISIPVYSGRQQMNYVANV